jgi:hypothetical protein
MLPRVGERDGWYLSRYTLIVSLGSGDIMLWPSIVGRILPIGVNTDRFPYLRSEQRQEDYLVLPFLKLACSPDHYKTAYN